MPSTFVWRPRPITGHLSHYSTRTVGSERQETDQVGGAVGKEDHDGVCTV